MTYDAAVTCDAERVETDLGSRIRRVQAVMKSAGVDAVVVTPGADLRYLTGYDALPLERLTALVVPADGEPVLVVPRLEQAEAERSPGARAGIRLEAHAETEDAYGMALRSVRGAQRLAVSDWTPALHLFSLHGALPHADFQPAGSLLSDLRLRKGPDELGALRRAAAAIDRVHDRMTEFLEVGRSEREVAADLGNAILAEGHACVDFVIVGSGPNGASPHHSISDRLLDNGDPIVVDIGGTMPSGYCSDSTRTYVVGSQPDAEFLRYYGVLLQAQQAQCDAVRPGVSAEYVDRIGRRLISDAGYGDRFIHRAGHGIGLDTHERPYIVEGNDCELEPGMVFSVEPGIYLPNRHGARIEDIVAVTSDGAERLNRTPRELTVVAG